MRHKGGRRVLLLLLLQKSNFIGHSPYICSFHPCFLKQGSLKHETTWPEFDGVDFSFLLSGSRLCFSVVGGKGKVVCLDHSGKRSSGPREKEGGAAQSNSDFPDPPTPPPKKGPPLPKKAELDFVFFYLRGCRRGRRKKKEIFIRRKNKGKWVESGSRPPNLPLVTEPTKEEPEPPYFFAPSQQALCWGFFSVPDPFCSLENILTHQLLNICCLGVNIFTLFLFSNYLKKNLYFLNFYAWEKELWHYNICTPFLSSPHGRKRPMRIATRTKEREIVRFPAENRKNISLGPWL